MKTETPIWLTLLAILFFPITLAVAAARVTRDVTNVIAQLPPMVEALTGVKLEELLKHLPGLRGGTSNGPENRGSEKTGS